MRLQIQILIFKNHTFVNRIVLQHFRALLVLLIVLGFNGCLGTGPYVPGEKGADWTLEETLIVKAKLWSTMDEDGGWGNMWQVKKKFSGK